MRAVGMYTCRCALVHLFRVHAYLHARSTEQTSDSDVLQGLVILKYFIIYPLVLVYKGIQNQYVMVDSNQISKNLLLLKREVEAIVGQRDEVCLFTNKVNPLIVHFHKTVQSLKNNKKVFSKIVEVELIINSLYSIIRYRFDLNNSYNGCYWDLCDAWEIYKYQVLGIELPENLI